MSQDLDIHRKLHANNGQYVTLLSSNGSKILMSQDSRGNADISGVSLLTLDTGACLSAHSEEYRKEVFRILGFGKLGTHIIEEQEFPEYPLNDVGRSVSLTVIETTSDDFNVQLPLRWVDWKQNDAVAVSTSEHPAASHYLRSVLHSLGNQTQKTRRFPWYCFGYYRNILPVLTKHLQKFGYVIDGQPEQVNFSFRSSTYRIPSKTGDLFFKACSRGSNEAVLTQAISGIFPKDLAPLVGIIPELNGILTLDVSPTLCEVLGMANTQNDQKCHNRKALSEFVMRQWAGFQQRSVLHLSQVKATGLPVCDEEWINEGVRQLITYARDHALVSPQQLALLDVCERVIRHSFSLWAVSGIPETIVHGDLIANNIGRPGGPGTPVVVFDVGRACIGYPFFDLPDAFWSPLQAGETAYLQCWESYTDMGTINELAKRTKILQSIRDAVLVMREVPSSETVKLDISAYINEIVEAIDSFLLRTKSSHT